MESFLPSAVLGSHCDNQDLISMSRSLHDAILSKNGEEVVTRLNMGEDVNQSHPPRCAIKIDMLLMSI